MQTPEEQIGVLADFIMAEFAGMEPSRNEGAVECAMRIMREQKLGLERLRRMEARVLHAVECPRCRVAGDASLCPQMERK